MSALALRRQKAKGRGLVSSGRGDGSGDPTSVGEGDGSANGEATPRRSASTSLVRVRPKLGKIIVDAGMIDEEALETALAKQAADGGRLGQILIESELITEEDLADALARQFELDRASLERASFDPTTVSLLPRGVAEALGALPDRESVV